jgi:hypothetical protein
MDEMEGLAIKITRAEWGVLKGWVPEIVANEVAGKLVEVIRPLLADAIAAKDATIAAQAAEIERLKENRDYWMAQYERAYELAQSRAKDAELADLRAQLAAAKAEVERQDARIRMLTIELDGAVNHHDYTRNKVDRALGEPRFNDCDIWTAFERAIAAKDATIAAQAAEIERLTRENSRLQADMAHIRYTNRTEKISDLRSVNAIQNAELAALRSQLEEQRKRLDGARKFVFNTPQGAIVIEPLCSKWRCYRDTMDWTAWENLIDHESNSMTFATLDKLFAALYAANWLAPHADTEST